MTYQLLVCSDTHEMLPAIAETPESVCWLHAGDFYLNKRL